ncbi:MAG: protein translocase subunit SecDF [Bacteroidales bacterium]|nr:protein translocase subunit SecDF [Bacteroidales bacterium]MBQ2492346.1 protein translocase subunit SecDF [Bacteroidales bacterium]
MQNKGLFRVLAILIALACLYQLSFTWATRHQEKKAAEYATKAVEAEQLKPEFAKVSDLDQAYYLDSVNKVKNRYYLDSVADQKVFLGNTYKQVKEKEIKLGLDLKGGMNVMMQVQVKDLIKALSNNNQSEEFVKALNLATEREVTSRQDFITLFEQAWDEVAPGKPLASVFSTYEMKDKIKSGSSNSEVISVIRQEAESAISNSFNVLRSRIDRFGVTAPNIQRLGSSGRILVELPGVKEPERVRKLLQGTASLEFWPTYEFSEIRDAVSRADALLKTLNASDIQTADSTAAPAADSTTLAEAVKEQIGATDSLSTDQIALLKEHPLLAILNPNGYGKGALIGYAHYKDTATINKYLSMPQVKAILPSDLVPMWGVKPTDNAGTVFELVAIKSTRDGKAPLDGSCINDASISYREQGGMPTVSMAMNPDGAKTWARLTTDNVGRSVAVVLDGMVYSYPNVNEPITGGRSEISGHFTIEEATDLANVLKSGKLPAPATILQEQVVGPSLGQESINAGMISFLIAFVLVLLYMLFFYRGAGVAANIALICNVVFLFGALISIGAVLTLPGIAGIVLTLGMAVDSNVIIYERIKEELRSGKQLRLAIKDGYSNAYSAILDGNITTIIVGVVLVIFGTGPIQGFATTLILGIITSLITSIFITRLYFEGRLARGKNITFEGKATRNFLTNTKIDFIGMRKTTYAIAAVVVLTCLAFIFFKGFSKGIDFSGGRTYVLRFDKIVSPEDVRKAAVAEFGGESVEVKQFGSGSQMKVTTKYKINDNSQEVDQEVEGKLYNALKGFFQTPLTQDQFTTTVDNPNGIVSSDKVGPTIANDMKRKGVYAVVIALFAIFLYIAARFSNWSWGAGGVAALAHDSIIVIGFYSIFTGVLPFTLDIDQTFIAAVLTIIGYSINDTVVIFDRIREYKRIYPKRTLRDNINGAVNSTLARTFNTSATTLVVLLAIAIFGGDTIRGFAVSLAIGVVVGTFSSVFIATPIMYDINKKKVEAPVKK